jgi:DNA uptake protein ComE-like DNA-binding protein
MGNKAKKHEEESWIPDELASVTDISEQRKREREDHEASAEWVPDGLPDWLVAETPEPTSPDVPAEQDEEDADADADVDTLDPNVVSRLRDTEEMLILAQQRAREAEERGERLSDELQHLERKLNKQLNESAAEAQARIAAAEAQALRQARAQAEADAQAEVKRRAKQQPRPPRKLPPVPRPPRGEKVDLNGVTFEALRGIGLSVTQSARLIAQRDERNGFTSLSDLDSVWGMPHETLEQLKQSTYV